MLTELRVANLGVIEDLTLQFGGGMTALTGETGAGKTLLVEALQLVLGGRGTPELVRRGAAEATVEARFATDGGGAGEEEITLARSVPADGRSRAWLNGRAAPLAALAETGAPLVDIHGQSEHQSLRAPAAQRRALDLYARTDLGPVRAARQRLEGIDERLASLGGDEHQRARDADMLRHQVDEITRAGIDDPDEDERLAEEEERLADIGAVRAAALQALANLRPGGETDAGAVHLVARAQKELGGRRVFAVWAERLGGLQAELEDVADELRRSLDSWDDDPGRLADVMGRRRLLADLRRKYGGTLADVRAFAAAAAGQLSELAAAEDTATALASERVDAEAALSAAQAAVREVRRQAAPAMGAAVEEHLAQLAMAGARLEVAVGTSGAGDPVEFMLGANRGEGLVPLARAASGGELARAMLALRLVAMGGPATMVFDEVDAGVGGAAALALGRALRQASDGRQVLVVTHLAQVAAFAHHQVAVHKESGAGRTSTGASVLGADDRVVELSRMLSGQPQSATARAHAEELLALGRLPGSSTTGEGAVV